MPKLDRTGPMGQGPMTGRGMGPCGGGQAYGRGGAGRRRGLGWRRFWGYYPNQNLTKEEETEILSQDATTLDNELKIIKNRLKEIREQK